MSKEEIIKNKIGLISLGCDKNRVDAEKFLSQFVEYGFQIVGSVEDCDILIINTCAFLAASRTEALNEIRQGIELKKQGKIKKLIVSGCLGAYIRDISVDIMENVDLFLPIKDNHLMLASTLKLFDKNLEYTCKNSITRVLSTVPHSAYLKIADGCNNWCAYCTIPKIRGPYHSVPMEELIDEVKSLVNGGVVEIMAVAQDTLRYGQDIYGESKIIELLQKMSKIKGLEWIRLHYCYPELITDELINEIVSNPKICKYIDVPLQHISDNILKSMKRRNTKAQTLELISKLKNANISIRSTFIVGFPGETKSNFKELKNFITQNKLDNVGFFEYSNEDGTASFNYDNQIPQRIKKSRCKKLYKLQTKIYCKKQRQMIGQSVRVLVDGYDSKRNLYYGRTERNSYEIDSIVYLIVRDSIKIGSFVMANIIQTKNIDLIGVVL